MKLRDPSDINLLSYELGRPITADDVKNSIHEAYENRILLGEKLKDFNRSQRAKENWKRGKWTYMKGIKKWHRSVKGKEFHRKLSQHLATSLIPKSDLRSRKRVHIRESLDEILKSISSIRTHLYIDLAYYKSITEQIEYDEILEEVISTLNDIELKLVKNEYSLNENELETLLRLIDPTIVEEEFKVNIDFNSYDNDSLYLYKLVSSDSGDKRDG